jgi:hypothetical protein
MSENNESTINDTEVLCIYDNDMHPTHFIRKSAVGAVVAGWGGLPCERNESACTVYVQGTGFLINVNADTIAEKVFPDAVAKIKKHLQSESESPNS